MAAPVPLAPSAAAGAGAVASSGSGPDAVPPPEPPKAELACLVCRSRKVRCDRTLPQCRNCARLGVPCPGYDRESEAIPRKQVLQSAEDIFRAAGVEKRRVGSCEECRASKHRCTRTRPACRRCLTRRLPCVYPAKPEREDRQPGAGHGLPPQPRPGVGVSLDFGVEIDRLYSDTLPDDAALRLRLVNTYFDRSHHLRCLSFLHRPSFMQSLERASVVQDYGEPLLYAMCALGARHIYFDAAGSSTLSVSDVKGVPGQQWAERARRDVLDEIHTPTVQHLMTMLLLCDYGFRADQNAMVFILVSFLYRTVRLLSLDRPEPLEIPASPAEVLQREVENRVVWACYFIDIFMASGVERNSCWQDFIPDIPLPCTDQSFLSNITSPPQYVPQLEDAGVVPAIHDLDLSSLTILVARLRWSALRLIRTPDTQRDIWDPASSFLRIIQKLDGIYNNLPDRLALTDHSTCGLEDASLLGPVFFFHLLMHAVVFDLTRISLAGFNFPLATALQRAPPDFRLQCQDRCRYHADRVSDMIRRGMLHGRVAFDDIFCADAVLESSKIQIIYAATVNRSPQTVQATRENLKTHLEFLEVFNRGKDGPSPFIRTLLPLCMLFGFRDIAQEYAAPFSASEDHAEVAGSADIEHLSQLAPFRRARSALKKAKSTSSPATLSSGQSQASPLAQAAHQPTSTVEARPANEHTLPTLRPGYSSATQPQVPTIPELAQANPTDMVPPPGPVMHSDALMHTQVSDYLKAADELSNYLAWDMNQLPSWVDFGDVMPPA